MSASDTGSSSSPPMTLSELGDILGAVVKKDRINVSITFLTMLTVYTGDSQLNIAFMAPSSTGKSYIPLSLAKLFPAEDVMELAYTSPQAFFHESGEYDSERKCFIVDLRRKILIFVDQPHTQLLERLRPMLSHDKKELVTKITDKNEKGGNRTKTVVIKGYPVVIFCSVHQHTDEQEATRFIILSPEMTQEKYREVITLKVGQESNSMAFEERQSSNEELQSLKQQILAIKSSGIEEIIIDDPDLLEEKFLDLFGTLKPRHQRDISRVASLVKAHALLNFEHRRRYEATLYASTTDIEAVMDLYRSIVVTQELGISPYALSIFSDTIVPAYRAKCEDQQPILGQSGLTRQEIQRFHRQRTGLNVTEAKLRQDILPMLEDAGLIVQEQDENDSRRVLVRPIEDEMRNELVSEI